MDRKNLAFDRINYILLVVGMMIVVIGFILMSGLALQKMHTILIFSVPVVSKWHQWYV